MKGRRCSRGCCPRVLNSSSFKWLPNTSDFEPETVGGDGADGVACGQVDGRVASRRQVREVVVPAPPAKVPSGPRRSVDAILRDLSGPDAAVAVPAAGGVDRHEVQARDVDDDL